MGKAKMFKINSVATFPNVFQNPHFSIPHLIDYTGAQLDLKGKWNEQVFKSAQPLVLELACGKGDYTIALAKKYPDKNFIGVDIKGPRIHTGAKICLEENISNVRFARFKIENIQHFFAPKELGEIWITFPDPFPKDGHEKHRLTYKTFLEKYKPLLQENGVVNLKTDDLDFFRYSKESIGLFGATIHYYKEDIYAAALDFDTLEIKTFYERQHLAAGRKINFLKFGY